MKYYAFVYPQEDETTGKEICVREHVSEQDILHQDWERYRKLCLDKNIPLCDITKEDCIETFIIVNWCWEITEQEYKEHKHHGKA